MVLEEKFRLSQLIQTTKECFPKEESFLSIEFYIFMHTYTQTLYTQTCTIYTSQSHTNLFMGRPVDRLPAKQKFISI